MKGMELTVETDDGEKWSLTLDEAMHKLAIGFALGRAEAINEKDEWYTTPRWMAAYALSYLTGADGDELYERFGGSA